MSDSPPPPFAFESEREGEREREKEKEGVVRFVPSFPPSPVRSVRRFQIVRPPSSPPSPVQTAAAAAARRLFRSDQRPFADN